MADTPAYDEAAAERHYTELFALLDRTVAADRRATTRSSLVWWPASLSQPALVRAGEHLGELDRRAGRLLAGGREEARERAASDGLSKST